MTSCGWGRLVENEPSPLHKKAFTAMSAQDAGPQGSMGIELSRTENTSDSAAEEPMTFHETPPHVAPQGTGSVPLSQPNGCSFKFWSNHPGLPPDLYLVYPQDKEQDVLDWANKLTALIAGAINGQRYMRARAAQKQAEVAARLTPATPIHRPTRAGTFTPTQQQMPVQPLQQGQAQQRSVPVPTVPRPHRPHPPQAAVPPETLSAEAQLARTRVENKKRVDDLYAGIERLAMIPGGAEKVREILAAAEQRQAAAHPPGSPGAAVIAAQAAQGAQAAQAQGMVPDPTTPPVNPTNGQGHAPSA